MNIPTSLIVVLLVIAWLVVLVPMIARRRERVPQADPAGSGLRVLRRASASLRRRPRRGSKVRTGTDADPGSAGDQAPVTVGARQDAEPMDAAEEWAAAQATSGARTTRLPVAVDRETAAAEDDSVHSGPDRAVDISFVTDDDADAGNPVDDPAGRRGAAHPRTVPDEVDEQEWADHAAAAPAGEAHRDVDDVQLRPLPRRQGRGGFDPEAAEATRAYRYQQRRRITLILIVATVLFSVAAPLLASALWIGSAVSLALLIGYLSYLRRQVRIEAAIRQRRMERLQRARQIRPEYDRVPRRPRAGLSAVTPGRTAVDLDDDSPEFDDLEEYQQPVTYRRAAGQ
jgi:hypothetical protein